MKVIDKSCRYGSIPIRSFALFAPKDLNDVVKTPTSITLSTFEKVFRIKRRKKKREIQTIYMKKRKIQPLILQTGVRRRRRRRFYARRSFDML